VALIEVALEAGDLARAEHLLGGLEAPEPVVARLRGHVAWHRGDLHEAAGLLRRSLALDPHQGSLRVVLARIWLELGQLDAAEGQLREARHLAATWIAHPLLEARVAWERGDPARAVHILHQARESFPHDIA